MYEMYLNLHNSNSLSSHLPVALNSKVNVSKLCALLFSSNVSVRPPTAVEGGVGGAEHRGGPQTGRRPGPEHQQLQFYLSLPQSCKCSHSTAQPAQWTEPHPKERQVQVALIGNSTSRILFCPLCNFYCRSFMQFYPYF